MNTFRSWLARLFAPPGLGVLGEDWVVSYMERTAREVKRA